jgi:hypothetical protein
MDVPNEQKAGWAGRFAEKYLALALYGTTDCPAHSLVVSFLSKEPGPLLAESSRLS